jgi:L-fuculokinase
MKEVTAIFDIGKTNKKLLLFDAQGQVLNEKLKQFKTIKDEDGFPCENINAITNWIKMEWNKLLTSKEFTVSAVNFTAFGASFVHLGKNGKPVAPLYDYLKPIPKETVKRFYSQIKEKSGQNSKEFTKSTCSPKLGMLNSGVQLYWLKKCKPELWDEIECSLHLPQFLSYIITGKRVSDYTSIGCHTALWNFKKFQYASWVKKDIAAKLAPITSERFVIINEKNNTPIKVGFGLHDSSAALIPYLDPSHNSFILISTGTWSIQLNPFNVTPLTSEQLHKDCLCYMQTDGTQVKASRLLLGKEHDYQAKRIADFFNVSPDFNKKLEFDEDVFWKVRTEVKNVFYPACMKGTGPFPKPSTKEWDIAVFKNENEAYHSLVTELVSMLKVSIQLVDVPRVKTFFVDGGFARNEIFMNVLAYSLYKKKVVASYLPQSTALGAFLYLHGMKGIKGEDFDLHFKVYDYNFSEKIKIGINK